MNPHRKLNFFLGAFYLAVLFAVVLDYLSWRPS